VRRSAIGWVLAMAVLVGGAQEVPALAVAAPVRADVVVSLGDSYSSGEGSRDAAHSSWDKPTRSFPLGDGCHRGPNAWPRLLGVSGNRHLACSGAKIADVVSRAQKRRPPDNAPQISRLRGLDDRMDIDAVLLTIGGNDLDFAGKLTACYLGHKCLRDLDKLDRDLDAVERRLADAYARIADATAADVVVVGYPDIFPSRDESFFHCGWLGENERRGTHEKTGVWHLQDGIHRIVERAAEKAKVDFVDIRDALDGRELCTKHSVVNPIRPSLSAGPGHPNATGQRLIADAVRRRLGRLHPHAATGTLGAGPTAVSSAAEPVLGSPDYLETTALSGRGFGGYAPATIFNGGVPSGLIDRIRWSGWGKPTARARGRTSIYLPQGGYFPHCVGVLLRATDLGTCPPHHEQAYTTLLVRTPPWPGGPLGPWLKWNGSRTMCSYTDTDPAYRYPARPPGVCGSVGRDWEPGDVFDIAAFRITCRHARQVARSIGAREWPFRCVRAGCSVRVRRLRCMLERVHPGETTPAIDYAYPVQRVMCRRGSGVMSAWLALPFD
jgi:lysophospholipase L1-like esterase